MVSKVINGEGVEISSNGTYIQGIIGIGGERKGIIKIIDNDQMNRIDLDATYENNILVNKSYLSFDFYKQEIQKIKERYQSSIPEISMNAWQVGREPSSDIKDIGDVVDYWLVGAFWDNTDQTSRFLEEGIWENGYTDRYLDLVRQMKVHSCTGGTWQHTIM